MNCVDVATMALNEKIACVIRRLRQTVPTTTTGVRSMAFRYFATCAVFVFIGAIVVGLL